MFYDETWNAKYTQVQRDYADYLVLLDQEASKQNVCGPHCDAYALHKPGDCEACNGFPALQSFRRDHHIAFTGEPVQDNERPCPATLLRPATTIHRWYGNRPDRGEDRESDESNDTSKEADNEQQDYLHWSQW